jgi:transcriptional regulator GlxA family with amidase domain
MKPRLIGIVGFDGVNALDIAAPLEAFAMARQHDSYGKIEPCYTAMVLGLSGKAFAAESGFVMKAHKSVQSAPALDTIIMPGGSGLRSASVLGALSSWVASQAAHTRRLVSIRSGIYVLAESGVLDGRHVTTHWRFAQDVTRRYPKLRVNRTAPFLKDGSIYTCGGGIAAIEMSLSLIEEDYGFNTAQTLARELVARLRPPGDEETLSQPLDQDFGPSDRMAELPPWIATHLHEDLSVEALAERACVCPRHFTRMFKRAFRKTPAQFVEDLRIHEARQRLRASKASIDNVAAAVGFKSGDAFRRAFERKVGVTPREFRNAESHAQSPNGSRLELQHSSS